MKQVPKIPPLPDALLRAKRSKRLTGPLDLTIVSDQGREGGAVLQHEGEGQWMVEVLGPARGFCKLTVSRVDVAEPQLGNTVDRQPSNPEVMAELEREILSFDPLPRD